MMLTCCPACATTFRITPEQLKARQGKVRCGECQHVFNAIDSLVEELQPAPSIAPAAAPQAATAETPPASPEVPLPEETTAAPAPMEPDEPPAPLPDTAPHLATLTAEIGAEPAASSAPLDAPDQPPDEGHPASAPETTAQDDVLPAPPTIESEIAPAPTPTPDTDADAHGEHEAHAAATDVDTETAISTPPETDDEAHQPPPPADHAPSSITVETAPSDDSPDVLPDVPTDLQPDAAPASPAIAPLFELSSVPHVPPFEPALHRHGPKRWPWFLGSALAGLLLLAQLALHYRVELAVVQPGLRPLFVAACASLGCDVPLPRRAELLSIETSDLHPDPAHKERLHLSATLRNRGPFPQEWPHLEVTLTDVTDKPLLVRALKAAEYLPAEKARLPGFPPTSEQTVTLRLDVGDLPAAGYRLYLYFP